MYGGWGGGGGGEDGQGQWGVKGNGNVMTTKSQRAAAT